MSIYKYLNTNDINSVISYWTWSIRSINLNVLNVGCERMCVFTVFLSTKLYSEPEGLNLITDIFLYLKMKPKNDYSVIEFLLIFHLWKSSCINKVEYITLHFSLYLHFYFSWFFLFLIETISLTSIIWKNHH